MLQFRTSSAADGQALIRRRVPMWTALLALVAAVAVAMTLPAAASAAAAPTAGDKQKARGSCANERGLTRAKHQRFKLKYGVGARHRNSFNRCVKIKARTYARRGAGGGGGGGLPGLGVPGLPGMPMLPGGIPEMPGVRMECQIAQMEDPIAFQTDYPGGLEMCVLMESMP
jgi:hypothetical protein